MAKKKKVRITSLATEARRPHNPLANAIRREKGRKARLRQAQRDFRLEVFFPNQALRRQKDRLEDFDKPKPRKKSPTKAKKTVTVKKSRIPRPQHPKTNKPKK